MGPHLLVEISAHGFGHLAQTAPVINTLYQRLPQLQVTLRTGLPESVLRSRLALPFRHVPGDGDIGMRMVSALGVQVEASQASYREFHAQWAEKVAQETELLKTLAPDLILSNIPYRVLAGAAQAHIPVVALSSLNWAAIYQHYCGHLPGAEEIHGQILDAYRSTKTFLRIEPALPMPDLAQCRSIGPIAAVGRNRRGELCRALRIGTAERMVLVALGGIDTQLPVERWPSIAGVRWLVPGGGPARRSDIRSLDGLSMPFLDLLASSHAVLTKPGYGTFVEAACNAIPVLSIRRPDWPETAYLTAWLAAHGVVAEVDQDQLWSGEIERPLMQLLARPRPAPVSPKGTEQAADLLASQLSA